MCCGFGAQSTTRCAGPQKRVSSRPGAMTGVRLATSRAAAGASTAPKAKTAWAKSTAGSAFQSLFGLDSRSEGAAPIAGGRHRSPDLATAEANDRGPSRDGQGLTPSRDRERGYPSSVPRRAASRSARSKGLCPGDQVYSSRYRGRCSGTGGSPRRSERPRSRNSS